MLSWVVMAPTSLRCICALEEEPETENSHIEIQGCGVRGQIQWKGQASLSAGPLKGKCFDLLLSFL